MVIQQRRTIPPSPCDWLYNPTTATITTSAIAVAVTVTVETHIETGLLEITCRIKHSQIASTTATRRIGRCCVVPVSGLLDHYTAAGASGALRIFWCTLSDTRGWKLEYRIR